MKQNMLNINQPSTHPLLFALAEKEGVVGGKKGVSVIEILVVITIISFSLVSILGLAALSLKVSILIKETNKAKDIAQATIEAVRNFRDSTDWNNDDILDQYDGLGIITTGVPYHPEKSTDTPPNWMLISGEETIEGFSRKVVFEDVSRNPLSNDIENPYSPANDDPDTKKATVTVWWKDKKVEIVTYFTNWKQ